jgi:predicted TIM-barrel fold metal-dependent hydrolase
MEETAMFSFPIIDTHVHLWDTTYLHRPWLEDVPLLSRPYGLEQYLEQTAGLPVEAIVCVEADVLPEESLQEVRWLSVQANQNPLIQGIVAAAPIGVEDRKYVRKFLDTLIGIDSRVKGVRRNIQGETMPGFCVQPDFVEDVRLLSEYNLSFDLCLKHWQLPDVIELVRLCPDTRFVLDHIAKPDIREHLLDPWREQIQELATFPNVDCKMSGMVTEADHQHWTAKDIASYAMHVLTVFGEDRVMFGGDWPVLLLASSYQRWIETVDMLTSHKSSAAMRKFWSENARRIYRLNNIA